MDATLKIDGLNDLTERLDRIEKQLALVIDKTPISETRYCSRNTIAKVLGVSPSTVWRWHEQGLIKGYDINGRNRYRIDEVIASIQNQEQ